jgi:hypothetical protein
VTTPTSSLPSTPKVPEASGPKGVLAALVRSGQVARRIAAQTQTKVVVVEQSRVAQRLGLQGKL